MRDESIVYFADCAEFDLHLDISDTPAFRHGSLYRPASCRYDIVFPSIVDYVSTIRLRSSTIRQEEILA
jgi:hypothetical protein